MSERVKWSRDDGGDLVCQHGTAADVHCCACRRRGFFPPDDCDCYASATSLNAGAALSETGAPESAHESSSSTVAGVGGEGR